MRFSQEFNGLSSRLFCWPATIILTLSMLTGCASPGRQNSADELITQVRTQAKKSAMQENLITQASQSTLKSYKDYRVGPEDLLEITVFGMDDLGREVRVNGRGDVSLPLVGPVPVGGLSPQEIETRLVQLYKDGKFIRNPQISVQVKEFRHQRVMVSGAVIQPGSYEVIGPRTLLEMLGKAGGLSEKAGDNVHIIRNQSASELNVKTRKGESLQSSPGSENIIIDLRRLLNDGALALNVPIKNGDVIYVPHAKSAFVLGAIKKPGQVPVKENLTVSQALALTEGLDPLLASNSISIIRFDAQGQRITIPVNLGQVTSGQAPDPLIKENDVIFVSESVVKRFLFNFRNLAPGAFSLGYTMF